MRQIAEAHGGEVKLVSALGIGSAFAIWIPATDALVPPNPMAAPPQDPPMTGPLTRDEPMPSAPRVAPWPGDGDA